MASMTNDNQMLMSDPHAALHMRKRNEKLFRYIILGGFMIVAAFVAITLWFYHGMIDFNNDRPMFKSPAPVSSSSSAEAMVRTRRASQKCSEEFDFDYLALAVRWPPSQCSSGKCIIIPNRWVIHGLWPNFKDGKYPSYCCYQGKFDENKLAPLRNELLQKWPNLLPNQPESSLWRHEWLKHGTCAKLDAKLSGLENYFNSTLRLFDSMPIYQWLTAARITPSNNKEYNINDLHSAIEKGTGGHKVQLECSRDKNTRGSSPYLAQIYICFDKTLQPIDCPRSDEYECGRKNLVYPKSGSLALISSLSLLLFMILTSVIYQNFW